MSHALTQCASATSSIVPVFISTVEEPHNEILTYALLDTQNKKAKALVHRVLAKEMSVLSANEILKGTRVRLQREEFRGQTCIPR
ncbi:uncharacterized protein LOC113076900 [Tachysurus ichikawai]